MIWFFLFALWAYGVVMLFASGVANSHNTAESRFWFYVIFWPIVFPLMFLAEMWRSRR